LDHRAVRDTIATVFRQRVYNRTFQQTLWDQLQQYLAKLLTELLRVLSPSEATGRVVQILVLVVLALIFVRALIAVAAGDIGFGLGGAIGRATGTAADHLAEAQRLAAAGRYTEAAHALYAALLDSLARGEELHLHPSKTVGDYARELRRRSSALLPRYRDFARSYEVVVYGLGVCDQDRYERLYSLASGMVEPSAS